MQEYRAFILGHDDRVQGSVDLLCENEGEAIKAAKQLVDGHDVELWQLGRLVETFRHPRKGPFDKDQEHPLSVQTP